MIHFIGDGGHAQCCKNIAELCMLGGGKDKWFLAFGNNAGRKKQSAERPPEDWITLIHPSALIAEGVSIGVGTVIMPGVVIQPRATIGSHVILNTSCSIDHDALVHDFVHVSPGGRICGAVEIGEGAWVGAGAICVQGAKVEPWTLVKAGTVFKSKEWLENYKRMSTR